MLTTDIGARGAASVRDTEPSRQTAPAAGAARPARTGTQQQQPWELPAPAGCVGERLVDARSAFQLLERAHAVNSCDEWYNAAQEQGEHSSGD